MPKPSDFDPYRTQLHMCECDLCYPLGFANRPYEQRQAAAETLLAALQAGTHVHMSIAERAAIAREQHVARVAAACADGVSERRMAGILRGYVTSKDSDFWPYGPAGPMAAAEFVIGSGVGVSAGRYAAAEREYNALVTRAERDRAAHVVRLIAADDRNRCVHFRFRGELCAHHAAHGTAHPHVSDWTHDLAVAA